MGSTGTGTREGDKGSDPKVPKGLTPCPPPLSPSLVPVPVDPIFPLFQRGTRLQASKGTPSCLEPVTQTVAELGEIAADCLETTNTTSVCPSPSASSNRPATPEVPEPTRSVARSTCFTSNDG